MISSTLRLWIDAVKQMEAEPGIPVTCPVCNIGTLVIGDIRSEADPEFGTRTIRCAHCGTSSNSRYHFGRSPARAGDATTE